jgi:flagellar biosynthesis protein FlhF
VTSVSRAPNRQEGDRVRLKTFRAFTLAEALDAVHEDLGTGAAILHTRTFKRGGFLGLGGREVVEVIASEQRPETTILPSAVRETESASDAVEDRAETPSRRIVGARARAAYGAASMAARTSSDASSDEAGRLSSGSLEVDRDRTRKLAQAMAIRLERQQAARKAAGVLGPDDLIGGAEPAPIEAPARPAAPTVSRPATGLGRFIIGADGELIAEDAVPTARPESAPRVVAIDTERLVADPGTGIPVATPVTVRPATSEPAPSAPSSASVTSELDAIRRTVGRVLADGGLALDGGGASDASSERSSDSGADPLAAAYASLVAQELSRDLADRVVASIEAGLDDEARRNPDRVRAAMLEEIADLVPTAESLETARPRDGRPRTIAFVGPTGVGKTTTLAKIAATLVLRDKLRVALVTADTYRISAVDQLRTYADILGARIEVAGDPSSMRAAIARCGDVDAILIDTPGRSQNDTDRLAELRAIVDAARPHETHLVLSGTASERVLLREAEAFSSLGPDRVVLTKLDEAVAFGMLVSVVRRIGRRISWMTTGQEVPRDIERATGSRLADLVLGGAVRA